MLNRYVLVFSFLILTCTAAATTHTVTTPGLSFSPAALTINLGDTVIFSIGSSHNVVEVEQSTWNSNGSTPKSGGFSLPFGGGTLIIPAVGTYYYVCSPHAGAGMKGTITVSSPTLSTGVISPLAYCKGSGLVVPFTASGTFNPGNIFTAQLSNAAGSFASPTNIGTLNGTASGQINATIPTSAAAASGYRVRVISSSPAITGAENAQDLSLLDIPTATITPAGPTNFCQGLSVELNATTGTGLTYVWRLNGTVISGAAAASYTATLPGLYSVEISNGTCSATSATQRVIVYDADPTTLTWTGNIDSDWSTVGNWDSPCGIPTAGDTVIIGSSTAPPASIPAFSLGALTINNSSGVSLSGDLQIADALILNNGTITLGSANIILAPTAAITGGGASSFIVTNGSGTLQQSGIGSGARSSSVLFPVGSSAGSYTPLTIMNLGTADQFSVGVTDDVLADGIGGAPLGSNVVGKTWHCSEANAGGSNAAIALQWGAADERPAFNRALCYVAHHDGADWQQLQALGPATGGSPYQRSISGVSSFSPFAIGDGGSPLPVEYRSLSAEVRNVHVTIHWSTEHEVNSRGFSIERARANSSEWSTIGFTESRGNFSHSAVYEFDDAPPSAGSWLYRLRQVDLDGTHEYSPVLQVEIAAALRALAIESSWPNPLRLSAVQQSSLTFTSAVSGNARLTLRNILGQQVALVFDGTVEAGSRTTAHFSPAALSPGIYLYRLEIGAQAVHHRMVVVQ